MPKVKINGIEAHYKQFGKIKRDAPYVLLIHGACQSINCWEYQSDFLSNLEKFNFIAIDLPGHGKSSGQGFTTISEYSEFIYKFTESLDIKRILLLGHSMGGRLSQIFALNHTELVKALILVGTGVRIKVTRAVLKAVENDFEYFCKLATKNSFTENVSEKLKNNFYKRLLSTNKKTCLNDFIACNEFDVFDSISNINVPTLIICGENDSLVPYSQSSVLNEKIKNSTLKIINDSGHFMMMEKPKEFNNLVFNFLSKY